MDFGWKFHLGNDWGAAQNLAKAGSGYGPASTSFSDASWRRVDLPHDWAIELPFDRKADTSHGFRAVGPGFPENSIGWYRRTFVLPQSDTGRRLWLEFDGVFRDCTVFVNGWAVGRHESGYSGARFDITDVANCGGDNTVAISAQGSQLTVAGSGGTRIWIPGGSQASVTFPYGGDVKIVGNFSGGNDSISVTSVRSTSSVFRLGDGNDTVNLTYCTFNSLSIDGGLGTDTVLPVGTYILSKSYTNVP